MLDGLALALTCEKILNRNGNFYTDNQIETILDYLYGLVEIEIALQDTCITKDKV